MLQCSKCGSDTIQGFIRDVQNAKSLAIEWIAGSPEPSFWRGVKTSDPQRYYVTTFRCSKCGFLESYAHPSD